MHCCKLMAVMIDDKRFPVKYIPMFREYGISAVKPSHAVQQMNYCPWCGQKLPESLRDEWFDEIDELGLDDIDLGSIVDGDPRIPEDMKSDAWWRKRYPE